jgi:hypothetical protein
VAPLRVDREIRRQGERPLIEALGAERFLAKWLIRRAIVIDPRMEKQTYLPIPEQCQRRRPWESQLNAQLYPPRFARWAVADSTSVQ